MTVYILCDQWSPDEPDEVPCDEFHVTSRRLYGPDIDEYWRDEVDLECYEHETPVTIFDNPDDYYEAHDERLSRAGFHSCENCGTWVTDHTEHLYENRTCVNYIIEYQRELIDAYFGDDPTAWAEILDHHGIDDPSIHNEDEDDPEDEALDPVHVFHAAPPPRPYLTMRQTVRAALDDRNIRIWPTPTVLP